MLLSLSTFILPSCYHCFPPPRSFCPSLFSSIYFMSYLTPSHPFSCTVFPFLSPNFEPLAVGATHTPLTALHNACTPPTTHHPPVTPASRAFDSLPPNHRPSFPPSSLTQTPGPTNLGTAPRISSHHVAKMLFATPLGYASDISE